VGTEKVQQTLAFGEDADGELYILTTKLPSPTNPQGVMYQIIDPSRLGHYKTWTLDSGLDHGMDSGLNNGLDN